LIILCYERSQIWRACLKRVLQMDNGNFGRRMFIFWSYQLLKNASYSLRLQEVLRGRGWGIHFAKWVIRTLCLLEVLVSVIGLFAISGIIGGKKWSVVSLNTFWYGHKDYFISLKNEYQVFNDKIRLVSNCDKKVKTYGVLMKVVFVHF